MLYLVGLLASAGMNARTKPLIVIAPKEIQQWFEITAQLTDLHLPYSIKFIDVNEATLHSSSLMSSLFKHIH